MKKILLFMILSLPVIPKLQAQVITNGSFENWTQQVFYEDPVPYITTNLNVFMVNNMGNVIKSTDHHGGNYSAKLETVSTGTDTIFGGLFIGMPGDSGIRGGAPFIAHPDTLKGYTKYNIQPNDTACIMVLLKNNGAIIGSAIRFFYGTQNSFTQFVIPINWISGINSDSIVVILTSSGLDNASMPGSTIYFDDFSFTNSSVLFPNGGFETWNSVSVEDPDNWFTFNFFCNQGNYSATKTTDSYDGTYALKLKSVAIISGDTMGFITNGRFGNNGPAGGMHVLLNPAHISGYYKYIPVGPDTALAGVFLYRYDAINDSAILLESQMTKLDPTNIYTYFEIPLSYNGWPHVDTINISFTSGNMQDSASYMGLGSILYLDKLEITYNPAGISENILSSDPFLIYPNPSNGNIYISINRKILKLSIYNAAGKLMNSEDYNSPDGIVHLDLSAYPRGVYFIKTDTGKEGKVVVIE